MNLSKSDARALNMILQQARAGNHEGASKNAVSFVKSAPSDTIRAKRREAVSAHILEILPTVSI